MTKFKVKVYSGTGHEEIDNEDECPESIYEFDTEAERRAFIKGVSLASGVMDGWRDAYCDAEKIDD